MFLYFLAIVFLLWLTSKPQPQTPTSVEIGMDEKVNSSNETKTLKSTFKGVNSLSTRPIAPFCYIWAKPLKCIQDS